MKNARWRTNSIQGSRERNEDAVKSRGGSTSSPRTPPGGGRLRRHRGDTGTATWPPRRAAEAFLFGYADAAGKGTPVAECLRRGVEAGNDAVRDAIEQDPRLADMGTTLSAAAVTASGVEWINVGDSPIYVYRGEKDDIHEIGLRHNVRGRRNRLRSALMGDEINEVSVSPGPLGLRPGDIVVIASDGGRHDRAPTVSPRRAGPSRPTPGRWRPNASSRRSRLPTPTARTTPR